MRSRWKTYSAVAWLPVLLLAADGCGPQGGTAEPDGSARASRRIKEMPLEEPVVLPEGESLEEPAAREPQPVTWPSLEGTEAERSLQPSEAAETFIPPPAESEEVAPLPAEETEEPAIEQEKRDGDDAGRGGADDAGDEPDIGGSE